MKNKLLCLFAKVAYKTAINSGTNVSFYDMHQPIEPTILKDIVGKQLDKKLERVNKRKA